MHFQLVSDSYAIFVHRVWHLGHVQVTQPVRDPSGTLARDVRKTKVSVLLYAKQIECRVQTIRGDRKIARSLL